MTAITKTWSTIADSAIDPDSPVTTGLVTGLRDNGIFVREWLGESFFAGAVQNHDHDGVNSAQVPVGPNGLRNGSFEDGETGWTFANFSGGSHAISTSNHADGAKSMEFVSTVLANGGGEAVSNEYRSCGANEPIPISFWVWASVAGVSSKVEVIWYDNAKSQISATTVRQYTSTPTGATFHGEVVRAPASARWFKTRITGGVPAVGTATGTVRFDGLRVSAAHPIGAVAASEPAIHVSKWSARQLAQATTAYMGGLGAAASTTETARDGFCYAPIRVKRLRVFSSSAVPASNSVPFTVRKNGADTSITCTIAAGAQSASDLTNSVEFGANDRISIKVVPSATAGTNDYTATLEIEKVDQDGVGQGLVWLYPADTIASGTHTGTLPEIGGNHLLDFDMQHPMPLALAGIFIMGRQDSAYNVSGPEIRRDNTLVDPAFTNLAASYSVEPALPRKLFNAAQRFHVRGSQQTTSGGRGAFTVYFESATPGKPGCCPHFFSGVSQSQATTRYLNGMAIQTPATTEAQNQIVMPACVVKGLRGWLDATPASGQTVTVTIRKEGSATPLTMQFTNGGGQVAEDLTNVVAFNEGEKLSVESVTSATVGTRHVAVCLEVFRRTA